MLSQAEIAERERELSAQGWTRQFTTWPDRVQEYVQVYESLGVEVHVEAWGLVADADAACEQCALLGSLLTIFTRKRDAETG